MNKYDINYLRLLHRIQRYGKEKIDRTGVGTKSITGIMLKHNMEEGFPALTTKKLYFKTMATELEGFIKGNTNKQWLKDRYCNIWNQWCRPDIIPQYLNESERKTFMLNNSDLGPIYGAQWNKLNDFGESQIDYVQSKLKTDNSSRRMVVSAWNHNERHAMALEPCHVLWQVVVTDGQLDLLFYMRSVDVFLGLPFDMAQYALILSLLAYEHKLKPGILTCFAADTHIYHNQFEAVNEQLSRDTGDMELPALYIKDSFNTLQEFEASQVELVNYKPMPSIKVEVAV